MNEEQAPRRRVFTRYSKEDRKQLLADYERSGLSRSAFCEERGIKVGTFYGWFTKASDTTDFFKPVKLKTHRPSTVVIVLPNGIRMEVAHSGEAISLAGLARELKRC